MKNLHFLLKHRCDRTASPAHVLILNTIFLAGCLMTHGRLQSFFNGAIWGIAILGCLNFFFVHRAHKKEMAKFARELDVWIRISKMAPADTYKVLHQIENSKLN